MTPRQPIIFREYDPADAADAQLAHGFRIFASARYDSHLPMARKEAQFDCLVLGEHPSAYLAAALLRFNAKLRVLHLTIPGQNTLDHLTIVNPAFFAMHKLLEPLRRKLSLEPIYGTQFLADDPAIRSEHQSRSTMAFVVLYRQLRTAVQKIAQAQKVEFLTPKSMQIHRLDEKGLELTAGKMDIRAKVLVLCGTLADDQQRMLGLPDAWGPEVVHRYTFVHLKTAQGIDLGRRPLLPMSLDLGGRLSWAWLLPFAGQVQLAIEQPMESVGLSDSRELLARWLAVLCSHGVVKDVARISLGAVQTRDLPLAGALAHEGVANRTLLVGPAGGFYSASGEDIYPNCWSALFAAEVIKKALRETHLQDAIQSYRQRWRTTLGDYLRGPQQNLRFLLPLVYRNQVMTTRLSEAILLGKSMVR